MGAKLALVEQMVAGFEAAWAVAKADLPTEQADAQGIIAAVEKGISDTKTAVAAAVAAFKAAA